jgi:hypothetical protein
MDASADVSYDHSVCTWLSAGSTVKYYLRWSGPPAPPDHEGCGTYHCESRCFAEVMT